MLRTQIFRGLLPQTSALLLGAVSATGLAASPARIIQVTSSSSSAASSVIREPSSALEYNPPEVQSRTRRRSEFVPISVPESIAVPLSGPTPELPPQPTFPSEPVRPPAVAAPRPTSQWEVASSESGPQLAPPTTDPSPPQTAAAIPAPNVPPPSVSYQPQVPEANTAAASTSPAMQAVAERALAKAEQATAMAQRGMLFSAQTELIEALSLIAQSLDVEEGTSSHAKALNAGLTALEEARDFARSTSQAAATAEVATIAAGHRTTLFQNNPQAPTSPVIAQQQYFGYAQERFAHAAGQVPVASQILYRLGRLQTALAAHDSDPLALHGPQAIVFHQAALAADRGNWLAANELGVLYARYGQLPAAKEMLLASVTMHPHVAGWQNLAAVHRRLGENDLATRANWELQALAKKGAPATGASEVVRWVDPKTFASTTASDVRWPADVASRSAQGSTTRK